MRDVSATQREAIAEAIRSQTTEATWYLRSEKAAEKVAVLVDGWLAESVQAERERIVEIVRDFPLNICGDGSPMPRDYAATVEDFRAAVLAVVSRDTRSSSE